jgi:hypothetical protein
LKYGQELKMLELVYINRFDYWARNRPPELTVTGSEVTLRPEAEDGSVKKTSPSQLEEGEMAQKNFWRICRDAFASKRSHA